MPKLLMAATVALTLKSFLLPHAKYMRDQGWTVDGMASGIGADVACKEAFDSCFDIPWSRNPFDIRKMACAYKRVLEVVSSGRYDVVHLHTPVAAAVGRLALRKIRRSGRVKIVYTAHGFHFYKGAPLLNWLLYYPIERFLSRYTDVLITINKEDYLRAKTFYAAKVVYVPGVGIDIDKIRAVTVDRTKKREKLSIPKKVFLLISVGELNKNKNHELVIKALSQIKCGEDIFYIIVGEGPLKKYLAGLIAKLGMNSKIRLLGYRADVIELLKASDCFVFPSLREGLPVSLMEAMASDLPVVCSNIRGNIDLVDDGVNGYIFQNANIESLLDSLDKAIRTGNKLVENLTEIAEPFCQSSVQAQMKEIYLDVFIGKHGVLSL